MSENISRPLPAVNDGNVYLISKEYAYIRIQLRKNNRTAGFQVKKAKRTVFIPTNRGNL